MPRNRETSQRSIASGSPLESTRTLVIRAQDGDTGAREEIVRRFLPAIRRWAHGRLPGRARQMVDTDDIVQVSFMRAMGRLDAFDPRRPGAFLAYLHQILLNCIREEIRRASRRPQGEPLPDDIPEDRPTLLDRTIGLDAIDAYQDGLGRLTEDQQQAVVLRIEFGLSHQEIADTLGRPSADAVRMQIARGIVRLAELMDAHK